MAKAGKKRVKAKAKAVKKTAESRARTAKPKRTKAKTRAKAVKKAAAEAENEARVPAGRDLRVAQVDDHQRRLRSQWIGDVLRVEMAAREEVDHPSRRPRSGLGPIPDPVFLGGDGDRDKGCDEQDQEPAAPGSGAQRWLLRTLHGALPRL